MILAALLFALSPLHQEWGKGPALWIMTSDEQRQWSQLTNDDEAEKFIALFWARRDPTPGTPANEFKDDFDQRVKAADEQFAVYDAGTKLIGRGAMSDRGRVLIVLGRPEGVAHGYIHLHGATMSSSTTGSETVWVWPKAASLTFGPRYNSVTFVNNDKGICCVRASVVDYFSKASPGVIAKNIVNPDLRDVPDWAKPQGALPPQPSKVDTASQPVLREPAAVVVRKGERGAHHLLLLKDLDAIVLSDTTDPFAGVKSSLVFAKSDDLGYVLEYCGDKDPVNIRVSIRGTVNGKKVNIGAPPVDASPASINTVPGCGMIRAAIPLSNLPITPGTYTFAVKLEDGAASYNLAQDFKIE